MRHEVRRLVWEHFHRDNPQVYAMFERFALEAINGGMRKIGGRLIWERMRWELAIRTNGQDYKLNNNFVPFYVRAFIARHPEHNRVFQLRSNQ
jgi:hypothetical protein